LGRDARLRTDADVVFDGCGTSQAKMSGNKKDLSRISRQAKTPKSPFFNWLLVVLDIVLANRLNSLSFFIEFSTI
jgi:hypothetical protein